MKFTLILVCLLLLFPLISASSFDINIMSPPNFSAGKENTFYYNITLFAEDDYFRNGDLFDGRFWAFYNQFCEKVHKEVFVFSATKIVTGNISYFVPEMVDGKIVESTEIVFMGKRLEEVSYPTTKTFSFGGAFASDTSVSFPTPIPITEENWSFYFLIAGIILLIISAFLIKIKHWIALFPLLAGLFLIILNIF